MTQLCAIVRTEISGDFAHVKITFGRLSTEYGAVSAAWKDWNLDAGPDRDKLSAVAELELSNQLGNSSTSAPCKSYGWTVQYHRPWSVDAERAEVMAKTLRKVERTLHKAADSDGYPLSFGQYALRVCNALGVKVYIDDRKGGTRVGCNPVPVRYLQSSVDAWSRDLADKISPQAA